MRIIIGQRLQIEDEVLGVGAFGQVRKGIWTFNKKQWTVAVKMTRNMSYKELEDEAELMSSLRHPNIVKFYGFCPDISSGCLVMEFMENGFLLDYIRVQKNILRANVRMMNVLCFEVSEGLEYLERRGYVHRDVAARNCFVDYHHVAKVADFGMAWRDSYGYQFSYDSPIPMRWAAPEVLRRQQCTHKSDVWSFGVLMWEVYTFGSSLPYGRNISSIEVEDLVLQGHVLNQPRWCPDAVYEDMETCFVFYANYRPDFAELCRRLKVIVDYGFIA